jgi:hypothetical protein
VWKTCTSLVIVVAVTCCSRPPGHPTLTASHSSGRQNAAAPGCHAAQLDAFVRSDTYVGMGKQDEGFAFKNRSRRTCELEGTPTMSGRNAHGVSVHVRQSRLGNPDGPVAPVVLKPSDKALVVVVMGEACRARPAATRVTVLRFHYRPAQVTTIDLAQNHVNGDNNPPLLWAGCKVALTSFEHRPIG